MLAQSQSPMMDHNGFQMPQMAAPPLMNPPPQIFGAYAADGLPNMNLQDLSQPIFGDGSLMDESIEAKRRRIARVGFWRSRCVRHTDDIAGLRYVQEEEDKM
jgi:hypothetical protein